MDCDSSCSRQYLHDERPASIQLMITKSLNMESFDEMKINVSTMLNQCAFANPRQSKLHVVISQLSVNLQEKQVFLHFSQLVSLSECEIALLQMASYNNCFSNIVYSKLSRRLSELIMGIAMSGTSVDQREIQNSAIL